MTGPRVGPSPSSANASRITATASWSGQAARSAGFFDDGDRSGSRLGFRPFARKMVIAAFVPHSDVGKRIVVPLAPTDTSVEPRRTEPVSQPRRRGRTPASDRAVRFATIRAYGRWASVMTSVPPGFNARDISLIAAAGIGHMVQTMFAEHRVRFTILFGADHSFHRDVVRTACRETAGTLFGEHAVGVVDADHGRACIERGFGDEDPAPVPMSATHEARTHAGRLNRGLPGPLARRRSCACRPTCRRPDWRPSRV